jgi:hypothetical protein|tara:strand:+ start:699 stop:929 length:231 start_codon:yes stop_codon:yes gene_type:complete
MYPEIILINRECDNLVIFERDENNPFNEGFIEFWEVKNLDKKVLTFKKRSSKVKALNYLSSLIKDGWNKASLDKAA